MALTRLKSPAAAARWLKSWVTGTLRTDSRAVRPGDAFIAWPGYANDGRRFVADALAAGASTCLVEQDQVDAFGFEDARIATLKSMKAATGQIAAAFFDEPSQSLSVIATTGTNGKTSTAWWTSQALNLLGRRTGVVGTLGIGVPPLPLPPAAGDSKQDWTIQATGLTTPDPVMLQAAFRRMVDDGFTACAIEASSIGIVEQRLAGTRIEVALFTNFTRDHLDYHGSMDNYWAAKRLLFGWGGLKSAAINIDDDAGVLLAGELRLGQVDAWTYSTRADSGARLIAEDIGYRDGGLAFTLAEDVAVGGRARREPVVTALIGDYNVHNLLAVIGGLRALGVPLADAARVAGLVTPVPGRMQRVAANAAGQPEVVVDYAHTPDALEKVIAALRPLAADRGGKLHCVFGCGGDRDATKRPLMGGIAARLADAVVVTSDNPRTEDPQSIVDQVAAGAAGGAPVQVIVDRRTAIAQVLAGADARDVVLVAGKGHEDYQEINGVRQHFSDVEEALAGLRKRGLAA
ncbi:MAG TPA: UDP-N-acetylmuramoyl-L-alanyl-D-glutamate--2,6-diaminopimelate ligase [Burkholderiaceae bacterium]